ncbi:unnamed protein product (macronuclear) [Paramecium tetraurelia]|uniref:Transmembrane protein n=1 Tax=Paramecium tetraurelia TaxID=5888 RepID=A0E801_PARTE|nr:uncharacterized protein GSPATT00024146001 [Paramecium tetraurelia]CAK91418.1 unnamed protein product [Paramecium tetraurelia]|eukprot:XP_001458815.1 hypothetical protein (macronuclear) [Paramecium tetraurelia strain d4-2]
MKKTLKYIRKCDHFGAQIKLNLHHKEAYKSILGGIITMIIAVAILMIFVRGTLSLIKHENYTISSSKLLNIDPPMSKLSVNNFMLGFSIDLQLQFTKPIYKAQYTQQSQILNADGTRSKNETNLLSLEKCSLDHFLNLDQTNSYNQQIKGQIQEYFCLPKNYTIFQQGTYKSNVFQYGKIILVSCIDEPECASSEEVNALGLQDSVVKISTLILNTLVNLNQEESIQKYIYTDFYVETSLTKTTSTDIYLEKLNVKIDESPISVLNSVEQDELFSIQDTKLSQITSNVQSNNIISQFIIRLAQSEDIYKKQYYKFDELISYVGGITKFIVLVFGYFITKYNKTGLQIMLANDLYQFDIPQTTKGEVTFSFQTLVTQILDNIKQIEDIASKFKIGAIKILTLGRFAKAISKTNGSQQLISAGSECLLTNQSVSKRNALLTDDAIIKTEQMETVKSSNAIQYVNSSNLDFYKNNFLEQIINIILTGDKKLKYSIVIIIKYLTCWRFSNIGKHNKKILKQSKSMIQKDMDILVIIQKLQEMEKLKHLLLNKEQLKVFNCLPKPIVGSSRFTSSESIQGMTGQFDKQSLTLTFKKKKLFETRHQYNTSKKLRKLYSAYESIKLSNNSKSDFEKLMNQKLIDVLEPPTLLHSFSSLAELQRLANLQTEKLAKMPRVQKKTSITMDESSSKHFQQIKKDINSYYFKPQNYQIRSKSDYIDEIVYE